MATSGQLTRRAEASTEPDAVVTAINFVVKRDPDPNWRIETPHAHQGYVLAYAITGRAYYRCVDADVRVDTGDLLLFPNTVRRTGASDSHNPWHFYSVGFNLHFFDEASGSFLQDLPYRVPTEPTSDVKRLLGELEHLWFAKTPGYLLRCRGLLMQLLGLFVYSHRYAESPSPHAETMRRVVHLLQQDYTRHYAVGELARMAKLSPSRFNVVFKEHVGHSVTQYQNRLRIDRAKDLLLSGTCNVTEASRQLGFKDVYYFSRLFKKLVGVPPSSYQPQ